jgi:hypothetical protein
LLNGLTSSVKGRLREAVTIQSLALYHVEPLHEWRNEIRNIKEALEECRRMSIFQDRWKIDPCGSAEEPRAAVQ